MKTTHFGYAVLGLAALTACGARTLPPEERTSTGTSVSSTTTTTATGGGVSSSSSSSSSSASGSTSSSSSTGSSSTGTGGGKPAFSAQCSGTVDCPMLAGCAHWAYSVVDDGASSSASATVTVLQPAPEPPCTAGAQFPDADAGAPVSDVVNVQCGSTGWSLGLDRTTMIVYVKADPASLEWTPACN